MAPVILPSSSNSMKLPRHWILLASPGSPIVCPPRIEFAFSKCLAVDEILWRPAAIGVRASIGNNIGNITNVHHESTRPSAAPTKPPPPAWSRRRPRRRRRRPIAGRSGPCLGHVAAHLACVWAVSGLRCLPPGLRLGCVWAMWLDELLSESNTIQAQEDITQAGLKAGQDKRKLCLKQ